MRMRRGEDPLRLAECVATVGLAFGCSVPVAFPGSRLLSRPLFIYESINHARLTT